MVASACARAPRPATPGVSPSSRAALAELHRDLDSILAAPELQRLTWAVLVRSLDQDEVLYQVNAGKLMMPASNMKILTMAAAAERLGWEYRFETRLQTAASIESGHLSGDLIVVGGGDPTINTRTNVDALFDDWAARLRALGIETIDGRLVGDDNRFDDETFGAGWTLDNLPFGFAAPVGALQIHEDEVQLRLRPGDAPGAPVTVEFAQADSGLVIENRLTTVAAGETLAIDIRRWPRGRVLQVSGTIPVGPSELTRTASVDNPTEYFVRTLKAALIARGIAVHGDAADIDDLPSQAISPEAAVVRTLFVHRSPPLSDIGKVMMTVSQNLYAETLIRALATTEREPATAAAGRRVGRGVLEAWGIPVDSFVYVDGSGLSRYNYVSAEAIVRILTRMGTDPKHASIFPGTLPLAGEEGTLRQRFKSTRAQGNVRAKTGSIDNARALSGYVTTLDGDRLVFSMLANHFTLPASQIEGVIDRLVERLANFSRAARPAQRPR